MRVLKTAQFTWIFRGNGPTLTKHCEPLQGFITVWPCWLQRHFERPHVLSENQDDCKARF